MPTTVREQLGRFQDYTAEHGTITAQALLTYAEHMREAADQAQATYDQLKDRPAPEFPAKETADGKTTISLMPTASGFRHMAIMFREAADHADTARREWEELADEHIR